MPAPFKLGDTNFAFQRGKLTCTLDASAGSSGKGKLGSFITHYADNWQFACCTFSPQAGHWVVLPDGRKFFYQTLNSCAYLADRYEKLYIGPGAIIELPALMRELQENKVPGHKLGISPVTAILQDIDGGFERGEVDFDGKELAKRHDGTMRAGTTAHGAGAARARRVLRRREAKYARDIPALTEYICDVPGEIMARLDRGQAGLLEVAQGFQLSYLLPEFFPYTTSRNCTVMAGLDDLMVPPIYAGPVILNMRTYPIRINSRKYIDKRTGRHLTWAEVEHADALAKEKQTPPRYDVIESPSGPGYDDQEEITWADLTEWSGSPTPIMEITSVTKLPRRVFTFSRKNLEQAIQYNRTGHKVMLSLNFANYVDHQMTGRSGHHDWTQSPGSMTTAFAAWADKHFGARQDEIAFVGTGPGLDEQIIATPTATLSFPLLPLSSTPTVLDPNLLTAESVAG
jgi:adenylosuccinate synthase